MAGIRCKILPKGSPMTTPINSFDDILNAMEREPALRDALRRHILTDELLQVPVRLERTLGYVSTLQEDVTTLREGQARLQQGQTELREAGPELQSQNQSDRRRHGKPERKRVREENPVQGTVPGRSRIRHPRPRHCPQPERPQIPRLPADHQLGDRRSTDHPTGTGRTGRRRLHHHGDQQPPRRRGGLRHSDITRAGERAKILQKVTQGRALAGIAATTIPQPQVMLADSQDVAVLGSAFPYEQTAPQTPPLRSRSPSGIRLTKRPPAPPLRWFVSEFTCRQGPGEVF